MARVVLLMLDGVGAGELPDSSEYGDVGSNTLGNVAKFVDLHLPNLRAMGLGNILPLRNVPPIMAPAALVGRLSPASAGKDTTVGHWEHMGLVTPCPFPTYPEGFPEQVLAPFREKIGRGVLGNKPASGTAIIDELGEAHQAEGWPIVYTSADSVFQIAAHVEVVPLELLYEWCQIARDLLHGEHAVARVIARPFTGSPGAFVRTKDRRDFSLEPPAPMYLDRLKEEGIPVTALGKISEIYLGRGVTSSIKIGSNAENLALVLDLLRGSSDRGTFEEGLLFTNLVDFDMAWGHRNDPDGFASGLEAVDSRLPAILGELTTDDRLIITADHGVDPTTVSTDHSREYVPLLYYPRPAGAPDRVYEGSFADTGASVCAHLCRRPPDLEGRSVEDLRPARGWRTYPGTVPAPEGDEAAWPVKVGADAARQAADWLQAEFGHPPGIAIVLGSGLSGPVKRAFAGTAASPIRSAAYADIPGWIAGSVPGHPGLVDIVDWRGGGVALLEGRLHAYEGFDVGELQLPIRTLHAWGVRSLLLTCAAGALDPRLAAGDIILVSEVLDLQFPSSDGRPSRLVGTDSDLLGHVVAGGGLPAFVRPGIHAAVPGPQYETDAENAYLAGLGAACVSMSLPAELRAARECGMQVAALSLITNSGVATHEEVLGAGAARGDGVVAAIEALLAVY